MAHERLFRLRLDPLKYFSVVLGGIDTTDFTPWTAVLSRPLKNVEVTSESGGRAGSFIPRTVVLSRPLKDVEVTIKNGLQAGSFIPRTAVLSRPLKNA